MHALYTDLAETFVVLNSCMSDHYLKNEHPCSSIFTDR